jgi:hypothetical protein
MHPVINGAGRRQCTSWIEKFVDFTSNLEVPEIWRRWSAISMLGAVMEQRVWMETGGNLYPNLYVFLVGQPGMGKSRSIMAASNLVREALPDIFFGATSMTRASLSDYMNEAKRIIPKIPPPAIEFNSLVCIADEFSAFMHEYDSALVAALVEFYDVNPYSEGRRVSNIRIKIARPQLNILTGSTPSNLIHTLKDYVWDQGLMSRVIMVHSSERPIIDVFNEPARDRPPALINDLKVIWLLEGQFNVTADFGIAMHNWKTGGFEPVPDHPKLAHYASRRFAHLLKLSMIASIDRSNELIVRLEDFNRAKQWLIEAEVTMPFIFKEGSIVPDSKIMDEIAHFVRTRGEVSEHLVRNFARQRVPAMHIEYIMKTMEGARILVVKNVAPKTGLKTFVAPQTSS